MKRGVCIMLRWGLEKKKSLGTTGLAKKVKRQEQKSEKNKVKKRVLELKKKYEKSKYLKIIACRHYETQICANIPHFSPQV